MDCKRIRGQLTHYILGELPPWEALAVEEHLEQCPECHRECQLFQHTKRILDAWEEVTPPPDLMAGLLTRLAGQQPRNSPGWAACLRGRTPTGKTLWAGIWGVIATGTSFLIVEHNVSHEHLSSPILLLCLLLWAGAYFGLFQLALSDPAAAFRQGRRGAFWLHLRQPASLALPAMGMMVLSSFVFPLLGVSTLHDLALLAKASVDGTPDAMVYVAFGTISALLSLFLASVLLGRRPSEAPLTHMLFAVCLFLIAVAPELLILCLPLTLGVYASLLGSSAAGALAGSILGHWMVVKLSHSL